MLGVNKTSFIVQHESCECRCGLNEGICNLKQKQNPDECLCKGKELDDWSSCEKDYMDTCSFECNKACKVGEQLDIKN